MSNCKLYVDFHVLQTVPPSCVNRDDTGSPKTALYGGATRARVSSQAWKRAMRQMFSEELLSREQVGKRTKKIFDIVAEQIAGLAPEKDAAALAKEAFKYAGLSANKKGEADTLFFMSLAQEKALAELAVGGCEEKKEYLKALKEFPSVDMVLFGADGGKRSILKL